MKVLDSNPVHRIVSVLHKGHIRCLFIEMWTT